MARLRPTVVRLGDRVHYSNADRTVVGLEGSAVRLVSDAGTVCVVTMAHLIASAGFYLVEGEGSRRKVPPLAMLDGLPEDVVEKALEWERHLVEIDSGVPAGSPRRIMPRDAYRPKRRGVKERIAAKAEEIGVSEATVTRMRGRYKKMGLWGLVDQRRARVTNP